MLCIWIVSQCFSCLVCTNSYYFEIFVLWLKVFLLFLISLFFKSGLTGCPRQKGGRTTWSYHCAVFVVIQTEVGYALWAIWSFTFSLQLGTIGKKLNFRQNFLFKWRHYWRNQKVGPFYSEVVKGIYQYQERKTFPRCFSFNCFQH